MMTIPPGTQSGTIFRLKGKGMPALKGKGAGDELVKVNVEIPRRLTERQRELIEEFEKISGTLPVPDDPGIIPSYTTISSPWRVTVNPSSSSAIAPGTEPITAISGVLPLICSSLRYEDSSSTMPRRPVRRGRKSGVRNRARRISESSCLRRSSASRASSTRTILPAR